MRYLCTSCRYIYDEGLGDTEEGLEESTSFYDLGDSFSCPVCGEGADGFHEIKEEVNYVDSGEFFGDLEVDHFPEVEVKGDKLIVTIGNAIHPMGDSHRISSVSLYDEYGDLIEEKFLGLDEDPIVEFDFDDLGEYEVRVRCSLHGVWGRKFD